MTCVWEKKKKICISSCVKFQFGQFLLLGASGRLIPKLLQISPCYFDKNARLDCPRQGGSDRQIFLTIFTVQLAILSLDYC